MYEGHENILHFLLKCTMKTHAEGVAESMGSVIDSHFQKRRGLTIEGMGKESIIHQSRPQVHLTILVKSRWSHFWYLVTKTGALESTVLKNVYQQKLRVPFLIHIRMGLLQDLDNLRISSLYLIVNYIQVLCNFAENRFV